MPRARRATVTRCIERGGSSRVGRSMTFASWGGGPPRPPPPPPATRLLLAIEANVAHASERAFQVIVVERDVE